MSLFKTTRSRLVVLIGLVVSLAAARIIFDPIINRFFGAVFAAGIMSMTADNSPGAHGGLNVTTEQVRAAERRNQYELEYKQKAREEEARRWRRNSNTLN